MKYLIVKGWLGFGDRLESLKMAVKYAQTHNLQIYVDWRDPMWSHGSEDFYTYFKLINMPVLKSLDDIPADATFFPAFWKDCLNEHVTADFIIKHKGEIDIGVLDSKSFDADVVVFGSCGNRWLYPDSTFFANVFRVVDQRVLSKIQYHKSRYPVDRSWGIHIRGTDHVKEKLRTLSVQSIAARITTLGGMNMSNMVVVSDDRENLDIWKRFYPTSYVVSDLSKQTSIKGNHNLDASKLGGVSKDELNVDMLVDFFLMASCERMFSTIKSSRFSHEAQRLHPFVKTILG
jgi:hypothetical protein